MTDREPFPYHFALFRDGTLVKEVDENTTDVIFHNYPGHDPLELFAFERVVSVIDSKDTK